jgi:histidine triad (HIT) family protein
MENDVFCQIAAGEIPAKRLYEDRDILAFPDINPQAPVHILIIPKKHFATVNDLGEKDLSLIGRMILVAQKLASEHGVAFTGYRLVLNCGSQGGQIVPHLHLHLLGGRQLSGELG